MASLNVVHLIGRTGKDVEHTFTPSGAEVAKVSIACSEKFKNKAGETVEQTTWLNLVFWGKLAGIVSQYVQKGQEIYVQGKIQVRKYDKEGITHYVTEIVCDKMQMLGGKGESKPTASNSDAPPSEFDDGDEIPF